MNGRIEVQLLFFLLTGNGAQAFSPFPQPAKFTTHLSTGRGNRGLQANSLEDCGCDSTEYTGKPSSSAQSIRHLEVISNLPIYTIHGAETTISQILRRNDGKTSETSLVVFLRSLG